MIQKSNLIQMLSIVFLLVFLGCGGSTNEATGGDGSVAPSWTANVFQDESQFKNLCQVPRSGSDPFTGASYPDRAGSTLHENHWLRSWSNNTYLWYDEITDINPVTFSNTLDYFAVLKTGGLSPSGQAKDQFHFTFDSADYQQLAQAGISAGYGAEWAIIQAAPPRQIVVAFTEPNSPVSQLNLMRGAEVLEVDGVDVVNAGGQASVDILNAGLFPDGVGESHEFVIRPAGTTQSQTITLVSEEITASPVQYTQTIDTQTGKVGYMMFSTHIATAEEQLIDAMTLLQNESISDLVLDLRYNGGGLLAIASQVAYMIAGNQATSGKTFDKLVFNNQHPTINPVTGNTLSPTPFYSTSLGFSVNQGQSLPTLDLQRVFILSTDGTCSASEAIINGLRGVDIDVVLIGSTTCGKPYGFYPTDNCGTTYFTVQFSGENDKGFGDYADGFSPANTGAILGESVPGCSVADDYSLPLGDPNEAQFKAALDYRIDGSCPAQSLASKVEASGLKNQPGLEVRDPRKTKLILNNRIINR